MYFVKNISKGFAHLAFYPHVEVKFLSVSETEIKKFKPCSSEIATEKHYEARNNLTIRQFI